MDPSFLDENTTPPSVVDKSMLQSISPQDHALVYTRAEARWYRFVDHMVGTANGDTVIAGARAAEVGTPGLWKVVEAPSFQ